MRAIVRAIVRATSAAASTGQPSVTLVTRRSPVPHEQAHTSSSSSAGGSRRRDHIWRSYGAGCALSPAARTAFKWPKVAVAAAAVAGVASIERLPRSPCANGGASRSLSLVPSSRCVPMMTVADAGCMAVRCS